MSKSNHESTLISDQMPFGVRFPVDIKEWIKVQAKKNRRSMNTEIIWIVEQFKNQHENHA